MLKRIVDNDRKKVMFRCEACGWESKTLRPEEAQVAPTHECGPKKVKVHIV